jgi:hypothetical protein
VIELIITKPKTPIRQYINGSLGKDKCCNILPNNIIEQIAIPILANKKYPGYAYQINFIFLTVRQNNSPVSVILTIISATINTTPITLK